jgi:hypothetical protein
MTILAWQEPTPDPAHGRLHDLRQRCRGVSGEPLRDAAGADPDLAAMQAALHAFVTDGLVVLEPDRPPVPLLHRVWDEACALHARARWHGDGPAG